jgi:hypothetical protein
LNNKIPHSTFNLQHSTSNLQHPTLFAFTGFNPKYGIERAKADKAGKDEYQSQDEQDISEDAAYNVKHK